MNAHLAVALGLALASAWAINWGLFVQHATVSEGSSLSVRRPFGSLASLFVNTRWLKGFLIGIGGWALYVVAVGLAPLSIVQAASAGGIGLLALLASRAGSARLAPRERAGVALAVSGLLALGVSLRGARTAHLHAPAGHVGLWIAASGALAIALLVSRAVPRGAAFGAASGLFYAAGDVATKAAFAHGAALILVVLACHGLGFVTLQLGFQRGNVLATAGVSSLLTNVVPIAAGQIVFGEALPNGFSGVLRALSFVAVVAGSALLARKDADASAPSPVEVPAFSR